MSKEKDEVVSNLGILDSSKPETIKIINEYISAKQQELLDEEPFKFRRFRPEEPNENIYTYQNDAGKRISFSVDRSLMVADPKNASSKERGVYRIGKKIASGGMGKVKEVEVFHPTTGQPFVFKIIRYRNQDVPAFSAPEKPGKKKEPREHFFTVDTIREEFEATKAIFESKDMVMKVRPTSNQGGKVYQLLPRVLGKELTDARAEISRNFDEKLDISILALEDLKRIHDKGWIHNDIKSRNIMYNENGKSKDKIKIIDFGLSKKGKKSGERGEKYYGKLYAPIDTNEPFGTSGFIAPEIYEDIQSMFGYTCTEKTDVYAMGIMVGADLRLSEMLWAPLGFVRHQNTAAIQMCNTDQNEREQYMHQLIGAGGTDRLNKLIMDMTKIAPEERCTVEVALKELYAIRDIRNQIKDIAEAKIKQSLPLPAVPVKVKPPLPKIPEGVKPFKTEIKEKLDVIKKQLPPLPKPPVPEKKMAAASPKVVSEANKPEASFTALLNLSKDNAKANRDEGGLDKGMDKPPKIDSPDKKKFK